MPLIAHGIDLVDIARIARLLAEHEGRFRARCYTARELALADDAGPARRAEFLAGRFAAKEAVLKALGTGLSGGVAWTDIEIDREPSGAPLLRLTGAAAARAAELGIARWLISISHTSTSDAALSSADPPRKAPENPVAGVAMASVIALSGA